jgi:hypothetical protein
VLHASLGHFLGPHTLLYARPHKLQVNQVVAPVHGILVAEIEAWAGAVAADSGIYLPRLLEGVMQVSIIWACSRREAMLAIDAGLRVYKYGHRMAPVLGIYKRQAVTIRMSKAKSGRG